MPSFLTFARGSFFAPLAAAVWLATEQPASAAVLVAQTGVTKTAICWAIVLLCIGLGLLVVCRPSARAAASGKRK